MRKVFNMNFDWQFHDGDIDFLTHHAPISKSGNCPIAKVDYINEDVKWDKVQLPHDLRHYRCVYENDERLLNEGYLTTGIGWYRKEFFLEESFEDKAVYIEFDGVYRNSEVYVNGNFVGLHLSGYTSFYYDISDFLLCGENNVIAVKADGNEFEGWWYEAAGIYRDVRLVVSDGLRISPDGIFAKYELNGDNANVNVNVELLNIFDRTGKYTLSLDVYSPDNKKIKTVTKDFEVLAYENCETSVDFSLENVIKWDLDCNSQYKVDVSILDNGNVIDSASQKFGMREVIFTADKGVFINGKNIKIKGVCVHDDFAGVGGAMSRSVIRHKIFLLKQLGCNGYRCSHNPPSPYLLEACDDFGILVMDEVRLMSSSKEYINQMTDIMKRDRNHPSIFMWSIGNEEMSIHGTKIGVKIMKHMLRLAKKLDDTRVFTYANNCDWHEITIFNEENGLSMDVYGLNYNCLRNFTMYEKLHNLYPDTPMIGSECGGTLVTRGQYLPREEEQNDDYYSEKALPILVWANKDREKNTSEYGETYPTWSYTPIETLESADEPYVSGYFIWTGFDYRGEVLPFQWPSVVSRFGIMDLCGFVKDVGHIYRVKWEEEKPAIHLYPHWTFDESVGELQIDIASNTEQVELIVNGVSKGIEENHLRKLTTHFVKYEPGEITAIGYNDGKKVIEMTRVTTFEPAEIKLEVLQDRKYIANGEDNVFVKIEVLDKNKNHCPNASNLLKFEVTGAGEYLGAGNGDPLSLADDKLPERELFNGLALAILRTKRETGKMKLTVSSEGLSSQTIEFDVSESATDILIPASNKDIETVARKVDDSEKYL